MQKIEFRPDDYFEAVRDCKLHMEDLEIAPDIAKDWLEKRNVVNRKLRPSMVQRYAWDMQRGAWDRTHQGIAFNEQGSLIDGQHRLAAIVRSGAPVRMLVFFNVPADYCAAIDVGAVRDVADILQVPKRDGHLARALVLLETRSHTASSVPTLGETLDQHRSGVEWARKALPPLRGVTASLAAAFVFAYPVARAEVSAFAERFVNFVGANATDPVVALRRFVESPRRATAARVDVSLATLRCLQAHCQGEPIKRLYVTEQGFDYFIALRARRGV